MTSHSESRVVPYPADLMFAIVADVERYPEFVPWTVSLRILKREPFGEGEVLTAETVVGYRALRERYKSRVVLDPKARTVNVTQVDGVFRELENHWRFIPEGSGCRVDFSIRFKFKSKMLEAVAGAAFGLVVTQMTKAFEDRARKLSEAD
ncbi:MAG: type II toxin-antitoxin system RatA family toxin [Rhizomicrobium sp.]